MQELKSLGINIECSGAESAAHALNTLAIAAERAKKAIDELNGAAHGGVVVQIVGDICRAEVKPVESSED